MNKELSTALAQLRHDIRLDTIEIVEERLAPLRNEMFEGFDAVYRELKVLKVESIAHTEGLRRVDGRLDRVEMRLDKVEARLDSMDAKIDTLASRAELDEVEDHVDGLDRRVTDLETRH